LLGGALYLAVGLIPVVIGLAGPRLLPGLEQPEQLLPALAQHHLPGILYVLFAGALISAILSTVDSALLAASALVSHNLVLPLWGDRLPESAKIRVARSCVAIFGVVAYLLALSADSVHDMAEQASGFGGAGLFVVVLFALLPPLGKAKAAASALFAGIGTWILGSVVWDWATPYLASLAAATVAFVAAGRWEARGAAEPQPYFEEQREEA
jgi:Na+/proline symporter